MLNKQVAVIFGSNGQDGVYLNLLLQKIGITVINSSRSNSHINGDISNFDFTTQIIKKYKPTYIFNFAANSTTNHNALFENHSTICTGTINILESVRLYSPGSKVFISGSAMQFKNQGDPINELTPFEASSPYSIARIQSVYASRYFRYTFGLKIYVGYFFNHDSPLRTEKHVNQKIVKAAQRIAKGSNEKLLIGNIDVQKEFNYAKDIVEAVWTLVNQDTNFEAVIGSGKTYSIKDWLFECFNLVNLEWDKYTSIEKGFIPEYSVLVSDPKLIMSLNWQPKTELKALANIMMNGE